MEADTKYLFIYGTLLSSANELGAYLKKHSRFASKGHFPGLLYNMGDYPGAIHQPGTASKVYGDIIELDNDPQILKTLDAYEGYGDSQPQPNLYIRTLVPVTADAAVLKCWVYLYNLPVTGFSLIASGRYK